MKELYRQFTDLLNNARQVFGFEVPKPPEQGEKAPEQDESIDQETKSPEEAKKASDKIAEAIKNRGREIRQERGGAAKSTDIEGFQRDVGEGRQMEYPEKKRMDVAGDTIPTELDREDQ